MFSKIERFTVRETKGSAGIQLPEKLVENVIVQPEAEQRRLYEAFRDDLRAEVTRGGEIVEDQANEILKRLMRLVQVASNPRLVDEAYDQVPGKLPQLLAIVDGAVADGSKVIVWTNFVGNAEWLTGQLAHAGAVQVCSR